MTPEDRSRAQVAAQFLLDAHAARARFGAMPAAVAPRSIAEAYDAQDAFVAQRAARHGARAGWKIALATPAMQQMVGLDRPIAGQVLAGQVQRSPARVRGADYGRLIVEFEIAVELGADLPARAAPYEAHEIAAATAALRPALELADDRQADYAGLAARGFELVAENAWNAGVVLGERCTAWREIDLPALRGVGSINDSVVGEGTGADAMGHPLRVVAWVASHLSSRGQGLRAGEFVITGSLVTSKFPAAGDRVGFDAGPLGRVLLQVD